MLVGAKGDDDAGDGSGSAYLFQIPPAPDLTVSKANHVGNVALFGSSWNWTITMTNGGDADATFTDTQAILSDSLPDSNISYGTVSVTNVISVTNSANVTCAIDGSANLGCTASGATVTIGAGGSFDVQFSATPSAIGTFINPRTAGICQVDPNSMVTESNEDNNTCHNRVLTSDDPLLTSKLTASDTAAGDGFGRAAISGDTVVVATGAAAASVYVFERDQSQPDNWDQVAKLTVGPGSGFGGSLAISGDTVVVGASSDTNAGPATGAAFVFERNQGGANNWGQAKKLIASDAASSDQFGFAVAISGDTVTVGAKTDDDAGESSGSAYVFQRDHGGAGNWGEVKKLTASDAAAGDQFGFSVAIAGDTVVVGALWDDDGCPATFVDCGTGSAYVFERNAGGADNWGEMKKLTASDAGVSDIFGNAVVVSGDTVVVSARFDDHSGFLSAGSTYVFDRNRGGADNWGQVKKIIASDPFQGDEFGVSVALSGDMLIVGSDANSSSPGSAYVFQRNQSGVDNWGEVKKLTAPDAANWDLFGTSTATSGDTMVIGAPGDDDAPACTNQFCNSGSAYVYQFLDLTATKANSVGDTTTFGNSWAWTITIANAGGNARFGDGQTIISDTLPDSNISYGPVSVTNITNVANSENISCTIDASSNLACMANGGTVIVGSGGFDVQFTATPSSTGSFVNPRNGGSCTVDPGSVVLEDNESNNDCSNTVAVSAIPTTITVDDQSTRFTDIDQTVTLTATVTSAAATVSQGVVTFQIKDGTTNVGTAVTSATLTDGTASVTYVLTDGTTPKDYTIEASYSGGSNFAASSGTGALTVNKAPTTVAVDDQNTSFSVAVQNVTLSATVTGSVVNQGTVTFQVKAGTTNVGSAVTSAPLTAGTASVSYVLPASTSPGDYTIEATYSGSSNFEASSGMGTLHVNQPPTISAVADQTIPEDGTTGGLAFTAGDLETAPAALNVIASSSNTTLVPTSNVVLGGAGANRTVTVTPAANQSGSVIITLTVTDGDGASTSTSFTVEVTPVNDPPVADDQSVSTDEETARAIILTGSDVEGSALTFSIVLGPASGTLSGTPPNMTYTPNADFNGADSFTFKANDGALDSNVATVSITVNPINDPPAADAQPVSTDEDTAVAITLTGSDPEGSALTFSVVSSPVHGTLSGTPPDVTYAPAANFNGADNFTFKVNDGELDSNSATVSIAVNPVNDAPNAVQDAATTDEDTAVTINVLANDTDLEGDPLTVTNVTPGGNGSVAINGDNTVTYTPNANFNGTDSFTYTVDDGNAGTDTATVNVIVASANDTVNAVDDSATTDEDTAVNIDVLANDTDADNDPLSVVGVTQGANGTVAINLDNTVTYTPSANFNGTDTFTYTVTDGNGGANTAQVAVTVNAVNDAPDAVGDADTTPENTPIFIEVTTNDTDVDGDAVSVSGITQGANGSVVMYNTSTVKYTPNAGYSGADSFSYTIDDGNGGTDTASVAVTVDPVNDPPNAVDDAAGVDEDSTTTINVLANDSDPEGDSLSVASVTQGSHGSVGINVDGTLTYTPTLNFNGPDTFNYTIGDGNGLSDTAEVIVTINPVNDVPDAVQDSATPAADTPATIGVLANDTDVDGDTLTVIGVTQGANGSVVINADNTVTYTPAPASSGTDSFTYTVSDGNGGSDTTTVTVVVAPDPNAINQQNDSGTTNEGDPVTINVLGNDSPAAGPVLALPGDSQPADASQTPAQANPLSVASVTKGSQGSVIVNLDGTVTYTPAPSFSGQDTFTYVVSDGQTGADTATVTVDITSVNDAPDAVNDIATTNEDTATTFDPTTNDTDEENNVLTVTGVSQGNHGSVSLNLNNGVTYTPNADFSGAGAFSYTIDDGQGGSDTAIVNVTVNPVNDMPNAVDDTGTTNEGAATTISALVNDTDVDGDTLSVTGATQGVNGSVAINPDGSLTYTPNADFNGTDSFGYTADDGQGLSDTATVTVTVNAVNDAPSFATGSDQTVGNAAGAQTVPGWATAISAGPSDEAGQVLTFHATNDNNALFAVQPAIDAATGNLTYTPASGANGSGTVTAILRDDGGTANGGVDASPAQTFTITITGQACLDFNNSGLVDVQDAVLIAGAWRAKDAPTLALYDFNSNGVVDIGDIMTVAAQFGQSCP